MKLGVTVSSERGKPVTKTGNDFIDISLLDEHGRNIIKMRLRYVYSEIYKKDMYELCYRIESNNAFVSSIKSLGDIKQ